MQCAIGPGGPQLSEFVAADGAVGDLSVTGPDRKDDANRMGLLLFAIFVGLPLIEIALFIKIGGAIGVVPTVVVVIVTALLGSMMLKQQGLQALGQAQASMNQGELPVDSLIHGFFLVIAGAFLLTPGFLTDTLGFLLFVPAFRLVVGKAIWRWVAAHATVVDVSVHQERSYHERPYGDGVIDGEAEEVEEDPDGEAGTGSRWGR